MIIVTAVRLVWVVGLFLLISCSGALRIDNGPDESSPRGIAELPPGEVATDDIGSEDAAVDPPPSAADVPAPDAGDDPPDVVAEAGGNTLWIGNSLMRFDASGPYRAYDIPQVVQDLRSAGAGSDVDDWQEFRVLAQDGFDLHGWWNSWYGYTTDDGVVISAARAIVEDPENTRYYDSELGYSALPRGSGGWTRIIALSLANYLGEDDWYGSVDSGAVVPNMERWYDYIRDQDSSTEILHYVGPADSRTITTRQPVVDALYDGLAATWGGRIVPVGRAFLDSMTANPSIELRRPRANDYIHFSDHGVYLAACVFFAVLYGDPVGLPVTTGLSITSSEAGALQRTARAAAQRTHATVF